MTTTAQGSAAARSARRISTMRRLTSKPAVIGAIAVFVLAAAYVFWPRATLADHAKSVLLQFVNGQSSDLHTYSPPHEIEAAGLSKEAWTQLCTKLIDPRTAAFRQKFSLVNVETWEDRGVAGADALFEGPAGLRYTFSCQVSASDSGPKCLLLQLYSQTWLMEAAMDGIDVSQTAEMLQAGLKGQDKDIAVLKALGIKGRVEEDPDEPLLTWEERKEKHQKILDQYKAQ